MVLMSQSLSKTRAYTLLRMICISHNVYLHYMPSYLRSNELQSIHKQLLWSFGSIGDCRGTLLMKWKMVSKYTYTNRIRFSRIIILGSRALVWQMSQSLCFPVTLHSVYGLIRLDVGSQHKLNFLVYECAVRFRFVHSLVSGFVLPKKNEAVDHTKQVR